MTFTVEYEQEDDGRWLAEVLELPGALAYGQTSEEAVAQALALRVLASRPARRDIRLPRRGRDRPQMLARIAKNTGLKPEDL
jgi:hypothetical protein